MTEPHNGKKTWSAKQNWIKDTLTKSGTELVDISKAKAGAKATQKKAIGKGKSQIRRKFKKCDEKKVRYTPKAK